MESKNLTNELIDIFKASPDMPSSSVPTALVIADRGYESYNNMAHIQEKGWFFLIRIKDKNPYRYVSHATPFDYLPKKSNTDKTRTTSHSKSDCKGISWLAI